MKKLEDGTEYLFRTEERDKDGNLVKSVRYAKDGKTVERVREFKMFPAGENTPARNVVASEICYGKSGEIIYKRTAHADGLGFDVEELCVNKNGQDALARATYLTPFDGNRFRPQLTSGIVTDVKTGKKIAEAKFGPKGEDDLVLMRRFDKKTGTKVIMEQQRLSDDTFRVTEFRQGQARTNTVVRELPDGEKELVSFERYDSKGRLRELTKTEGENRITKIIDPKGRELIIETRPDGSRIVRRTYEKDDHFYIQTFESDGGISLRRDGVEIGDIKRSYAPQKAKFVFPDYELNYDAAGKKVSKKWNEGGVEHTILYDKAGNIVSRE